MKNFVRILTVALIAVMIVGLFAGCPSTKPNKTTKISTLEEEKGATLKILIPGHNPKNNSLWQNKVVEEFKKQYPDVTVQFVTADWSNWSEKLMAAYQAGDPIDLINDGVNNNPRFPLEGITQPLQHYVNMQNPNLQKEAMDACFMYNDNYYVAASETNFGVVYYNKDLFQAAGLEDPMSLYEKGEWTWANFVRAAKKLTNKDEKKWGFATEFPYLFYGSNATSTLKLDKNGKYELNMDDPAFVAALEMIQDGTFNSGWSGWEGNALSSFQSGNSAMLGSFTMYEKEIDSLHNTYPDLYPSMNYGVVPLPKGPNNPTGMNMVHSAGWAIGSGSDCPAHVGKLIDMMVDGHAAYQAEENQKLPEAHVALYKEMRKNQFCVNTRDSAIGGGYELAGEVGSGTSVAQAIEKFKPEYDAKIKEVNGK